MAAVTRRRWKESREGAAGSSDQSKAGGDGIQRSGTELIFKLNSLTKPSVDGKLHQATSRNLYRYGH